MEEFKNIAKWLPPGPVLVHTDIFRTRHLIQSEPDPALWMEAHFELLRSITDGRPLIFPAFNYDFLRSKKFDPQADPVQVGAFNEWFRQKKAAWRDPTPAFSLCGMEHWAGTRTLADMVDKAGVIDPFSESGSFGVLERENGSVLMYGADFSSFTAIHYIERQSGGPVYRYDKYFEGDISGCGPATLKYHVRPLGLEWDYDWQRLYREGLDKGLILAPAIKKNSLNAVSFRHLSKFWQSQLKTDPLSLVLSSARPALSERLAQLGRRFELGDFE